MDDPYGSSRGTHNYPSPNAARSHTHSAANLCPRWDFDEFMAVPGCVVAEHEPVVWDN